MQYFGSIGRVSLKDKGKRMLMKLVKKKFKLNMLSSIEKKGSRPIRRFVNWNKMTEWRCKSLEVKVTAV